MSPSGDGCAGWGWHGTRDRITCQRWTGGDACAVTTAPGQRRASTTCAGPGGRACVATRCLHQAETWYALQGLQLQRLKNCMEQTVAHHCRGHRPPSPGQRWKSNEAVQRLFSEGCQASTVVCAGHAAVRAARRGEVPWWKT